jgi:predicted ribosome quality control (RQC) complex YloA/Tae2 family protein
MMRNTLAAGLHCTGLQAEELLNSAGINPTRRAQTLDLVEWKTLVGEYETWVEKNK